MRKLILCLALASIAGQAFARQHHPGRTYTVTPSAGTGGTISPATAKTVNSGNKTSFTVTPNSGYKIASVTGCTGSLSSNTYTTGSIRANCSVSATFAATTSTYTVTPSAGTGGTISPATAKTVNSGNKTSFTVTPNSGYKIASVAGCAGTLSGNTYTTGAITGNCAVASTFAASTSTYTVTPSAGAGGTISPAAAQTVTSGNKTSFAVTPSSGYKIASVTGCAGTLSGNTYTTGAITAKCAVAATFAASTSTYTVTPSAGTGGSISPTGTQTVNSGSKTSFSVAPKSGYKIAAVSGCAGALSGSTYTTGAVTANCAVAATFSSTSAGSGSSHYVLKGAKGSNSGSSWTDAWSEMSQIGWSSVACGDTIWIGGGTYTSGLTINKTCTASTPLTIQSVLSTDSVPAAAAGYTSAVLGQVIILNGGVNLSGGAFVTLSGRVGSPTEDNFGISVQCTSQGGCDAFSGAGSGNLTNFTVTYVEMYGPACVLDENCGGGGASGFNVAPSNNKVVNLLLDHDWIHRWGEAIRTSNWSNAIIQYTDIDTTHNDGPQHEDVMYNYAQTNLTMRYNRIWNSPNDGIFFDFGGTNGFYFYGNVFYGSGGEYIVFKSGYTNAVNVYIYNNVFEANGNGDYSYGWLDFNGASSSSGAVQNNVFENVAVSGTMPSPNYNAYSVSSYKDKGAQSFLYTPGTQFVNEPNPNDYAAADFQLTAAGKTTFGRGVALAAPYNQNPDAATRGAGGIWNIGAY